MSVNSIQFQNFGFGVVASAVVTPLALGASFFARKVGLIPEMGDHASMIKEQVVKLAKTGLKFDADALANAECYNQEFVTQLNQNVLVFHSTVLSYKTTKVLNGGLGVPIIEEILFRGLLQDVMLQRIPKGFIKILGFGDGTSLNTTAAKIIRITLAAALFSSSHLSNTEVFADSYVSSQVVATFVLGIGLGMIKESQAGLLGSIGAHIANNLIALAPDLWDC